MTSFYFANPLEIVNWNESLDTRKESSIFYTQNWLKVLINSYHYYPKFVTPEDPRDFSSFLPLMEINSRLTGKRAVCLPFTDFCEPMLDDKIQFQSIFKFLIEYGKRNNWKNIEFKGGRSFMEKESPYLDFYVHRIHFNSSENDLFSHFRSSTKRNIKKAVNAGLKIELSHTVEAMQDFFTLNCLTKKRHGIPIQPFHFFKNIHDHIISPGFGFIGLAKYRGKIIAGAVFFHIGKTGIFVYGASDKNYQHLRPNNLLLWETIRWFHQNGFNSFSFGITDVDNQGLRQFKAGMATEEELLSYYRYQFSGDAFVKADTSASKTRRKIFQKMPVVLLKAVGFALYKHYG